MKFFQTTTQIIHFQTYYGESVAAAWVCSNVSNTASLATAHLLDDCDSTALLNASELALAGKYDMLQDATGLYYLSIPNLAATKGTCSKFGYKAVFASCAKGNRFTDLTW